MVTSTSILQVTKSSVLRLLVHGVQVHLSSVRLAQQEQLEQLALLEQLAHKVQ
jgi:hypothetical protein